MSYIRCLSNPEGLYIWGEEENKLAISIIKDGDLYVQYMPENIFESLIKRWIRAREEWWYTYDDVKWKGARIQEVKIGMPLKELMIKASNGEDVEKEAAATGIRWRLTYKKVKVDMHLSTLFYLAYSNPERWGYEIKKKKQRKKK